MYIRASLHSFIYTDEIRTRCQTEILLVETRREQAGHRCCFDLWPADLRALVVERGLLASLRACRLQQANSMVKERTVIAAENAFERCTATIVVLVVRGMDGEPAGYLTIGIGKGDGYVQLLVDERLVEIEAVDLIEPENVHRDQTRGMFDETERFDVFTGRPHGLGKGDLHRRLFSYDE